ncbi:hypothetical protein BAE46_01425 [Glaciecola punicea]|jgi:uncharacterized protein|nr:23S rRNA accumulation protein YceD [Glaciecola punicea]OFA33393.1 hypothetical protein BAE46_01425 [Glaciecola punicea]
MTNVKLPKKLDPNKSAQLRSKYDGVYLAREMLRYSSAVADAAPEVHVKIEFSKDAQSLTYFNGEMRSQVQLICQRCNEVFDHSVHTEFCYTPVQGSEQTDLLPDAYDPVQVDDQGEVDLFELLEDELILSLPLVPLHSHEECKVKAENMQFGDIEPGPVRENPFAVLKELKRD